ncbi:MAG: uroporphyrinogen decarboxylase [Alphaproteobacteria bacterium]
MTEFQIEFIGYVASALIILSMFFHNQSTLRAINIVGSIVFIIYGELIDSIPIIITNVAILSLHIRFFYHKRKLKK